MVVREFHWADYVVFGISLGLSLCVGIFFAIRGRFRETPDEFLVGSRDVHLLPVAFSMVVSIMNAIFLVGIPAEVYFNGVIFSLNGVGTALVAPIIAHIYIPVLHRMKLTSAYEYLERRYNVACRIAAALTFSLSMIVFLAVVLYVPAFVFTRVTGLDLVWTIIVTGAVCTVYTAIGGIKAVIWTDTLQTIIIFIGLLLLVIMGGQRAGTASEIWDAAHEIGLFNYNEWSFHPHARHTVWTQVIGMGVIFMAVMCSNQMLLQRIFAVKKLRDAQLSVYVTTIGFMSIIALVTMLGVVMHVFYRLCDPMFMAKGQGINQPDEMVPYFLMEILGQYHGLPGLFCASVFAAALSSVSSALNSLSAVFVEDFLKPAHRIITNGKTMKNSTLTWIGKITAFLFGVLTVGLSFAARHLSPRLVQIPATIWGAVNGPLLGLFTLALFFPWSNGWGAFIGLIVSLAFNLWLALGQILHTAQPKLLTKLGMQCENMTLPPQPPPFEPSALSPFYDISYTWVGVNGAVSCFLVGLICSLVIKLYLVLRRRAGKRVDPSLMYPFHTHGCCAFSKSFLKCWLDDHGTEQDTSIVVGKVSRTEEYGSTNPAFNDKPVQYSNTGYYNSNPPYSNGENDTKM